jgi:hypothetical protein
MKKNKIITLGVLIMSTTVFSGTEIDALKDRITKLENNATKVEISGEDSVNFTKGDQANEAEIGIATSIAAGFNSNILSEPAGSEIIAVLYAPNGAVCLPIIKSIPLTLPPMVISSATNASSPEWFWSWL